MKTSVIIPNFNGEELLQKNLPSVLDIKADEVIVVDDASSDKSVQILQSQFPQITTIVHQKNKGFGQTVNDGAAAATGDIVLFLNTDTRPKEDCLAHVSPYFDRPEIFAVTCHEPGNSWATGSFVAGFFHHEPGPETDQPHISLYASGGSAAFSRQKFLALGGFDKLYHPFYWEDTDISYRAWKRGYEVWWEPKAIVEHQTSSTIKKYFSQGFRDYIVQRNELLFNWKNMTDDDLFRQHKKAVRMRILSHPGYIRPFLGALKKLSDIKIRRQDEIKQSKLTDKQIFNLFTNEK